MTDSRFAGRSCAPANLVTLWSSLVSPWSPANRRPRRHVRSQPRKRIAPRALGLFGRAPGPGFQALNDVSLRIEHGEFFGLLGPNGAGKTTLISILAGLAHATSGRASVCGYDVVADYKSARRALGVVPQELVYDPFFTVRETLRIQSGYFGLRKNDDWIDEILFNLGLADKANSNMRALSGGMKRRVLVAQALVHRPPVIVLDEPTAGVDVDLRRTLWNSSRA